MVEGELQHQSACIKLFKVLLKFQSDGVWVKDGPSLGLGSRNDRMKCHCHAAYSHCNQCRAAFLDSLIAVYFSLQHACLTHAALGGQAWVCKIHFLKGILQCC